MAGSRDTLVRRHFEAMRDLTWVEELEPQFTEYGMDTATMAKHREGWNLHAERRDWEWWQQETKRFTVGELEDMLMDCIEKLDAIGMLRCKKDRQRFHQILKEEPESENRSHDQTKQRTGGRDI